MCKASRRSVQEAESQGWPANLDHASKVHVLVSTSSSFFSFSLFTKHLRGRGHIYLSLICACAGPSRRSVQEALRQAQITLPLHHI